MTTLYIYIYSRTLISGYLYCIPHFRPVEYGLSPKLKVSMFTLFQGAARGKRRLVEATSPGPLQPSILLKTGHNLHLNTHTKISIASRDLLLHPRWTWTLPGSSG